MQCKTLFRFDFFNGDEPSAMALIRNAFSCVKHNEYSVKHNSQENCIYAAAFSQNAIAELTIPMLFLFSSAIVFVLVQFEQTWRYWHTNEQSQKKQQQQTDGQREKGREREQRMKSNYFDKGMHLLRALAFVPMPITHLVDWLMRLATYSISLG